MFSVFFIRFIRRRAKQISDSDDALVSYSTFLLLWSVVAMAAAQDICTSDTNTFTVIVDLFAGELGYFTFKECPGLVVPTIGIELGETYTFVQEDRSNWYHPMGFAYFPDGDHDGKDELEPVVSETGSSCVNDTSCPAPHYMLDGVFLGMNGTADFGLDVYEPGFFLPLIDWIIAGVHSIEVNFDDANYTKDIFYFCHIHQYMSGRIKLLKNGAPVNEADDPVLGYNYDSPGEFDKECGTFGLDDFQLPNSQCPDRFVCLNGETDSNLKQFSTCIDAMDCAMMAGMTTGFAASSQVALFIHQMIPHHQNAVNMAKALLHEEVLVCDDLTNEDDADCNMERILRDIVNTQNFQIQGMRGVLKDKGLPKTEDCVVEISTVRDVTEQSTPAPAPGTSDGGLQARLSALTLAALIAAILF